MFKVVIDPGHGGKDRANRGPTGYIEADGVLKISLYLAEELRSTGKFDVKLTRSTDAYLTLTDRGLMGVNADLFISEHTNASGKPYDKATARGCDVYYSVDLTGDKTIATAMSTAVAKAIGTTDRGAKTREYQNSGEDYYTVIDTAQDHGAKHVLLCESAFHDNAQDEALLKVDANLKKIAQAQAGVICSLFGVSYPVATKPADKVTPIMGAQVATADQLYAYAIAGNPLPKLSVPLYELCKIFLDEGEAEGVRGDIAFCQSCKETAFFAYGGKALPEWNNFSGLGVTGAIGPDGKPVGNKFPDARTGVRAQIQHLKAYASTEPLEQVCVDQRFSAVKRGRAPYWEWLGRDENPENASRDASDRQGWAVPGATYGHDIITMLGKVLAYPKVGPSILIYGTPKISVIHVGGSITLGESSLIEAEGTNCHHIALFVNDNHVNTQQGNIYNYQYTPEAVGRYKIKLMARNAAEEVEGSTLISSEVYDLIVTEKEEPTNPDEKVDVGLVNKILELLFEWLQKLLK